MLDNSSLTTAVASGGLPEGWLERNSPADCSEGFLSPSCSSSRDIVDLITPQGSVDNPTAVDRFLRQHVGGGRRKVEMEAEMETRSTGVNCGLQTHSWHS
jgi:hypothetical protein